MKSFLERDKKYLAGTYNRFPVEIEKGKGSEVFDIYGKRYIDMGSGIGVTAFGVCDEEWVGAVSRQLSTVQHMSNLYYTAPCSELAELLCGKTGMKKVFFGNSGAEANECAIKAARKYSAERKGADAYTIVTLKNSFHGRTLTTLSATGQDHYHELFQPLTPGFASIDADNGMAELEALARSTKIAGCMIECIQGEGGVRMIDGDFIRALDKWCHDNDVPFIVDEVQTGNGRTGKMYSYMHFGVSPDVVTTAKGLGGGLPIGAALLSEKLANVFGFGDHGSTFGGNPVACAGGVSIVSRLTDDFLAEVMEKGRLVREAFAGAPGIEGVTGLGLMVGIKTTKPAGEVVGLCLERGVLCLTAKDKVRLLPALNIPREILLEACEVIKACARA